MRFLQNNERKIDMTFEKSNQQKTVENFNDLAEEWMKAKMHCIKQSTLLKYKHLLETHILPYFKNVSITCIDTILINNTMMQIYEEHKDHLAYSTFRSIFYLIRTVTSYGVAMGYYDQLYYNFRIVDRSAEKEIQILTPYQEQMILRQITFFNKPNHLGILLSLCTGLRLGEVCSLKVEDIDFDAKIIRVNKTVQRLTVPETGKTELIVTDPKSNHSNRQIPLSDFLNDILISYNIDRYNKEHYILTNADKPYEPRTLEYAFQRITESCGFNGLHFHCLRHTFATKCIDSGFDVKMVSEILGHASVSFTLNRYVHPSIDSKREKMKLLDAQWNKIYQ